MNEPRNSQTRPATEPDRESGAPGDGRGRKDEVGGSGVYPASAENAPRSAEIRTQAAWGQGDRGAAGYEDSGQSEVSFSDVELEAARHAEEAEQARSNEASRKPEVE